MSGEFEKLNCAFFGISTDSKFSHLAWLKTPRNKGGIAGLKYPLLADFTKKTSCAFGVLNEKLGVALRGTFLIDPQGIVQWECVNNLPIGRSVEETLRVLSALQHNKEAGEVCPVNWKKGGEAINPKQASKYFEKQK